MGIYQSQLPYALTYTYNFFAASAYFERFTNFLTHLWSLAVEEQFYIFWPLLIFLVPEKKFKPAFLSVIGLSVLFRLFVMAWPSHAIPGFLSPDPLRIIYFLPFSHLDAFALGALLTMTDIPKARQQFMVLLVGLPILGILTDFLASGSWSNVNALGYPLLLPFAWKAVWGYTALNYFFAVLIFGVARLSWFERALEFPPIAYLGRISYGLYIYHFAIIWLLSLPFGFSSGLPMPWWIAALALLATTLVSSLSYRFIEKPFLNFKDRFFSLPKGVRGN
jgi:peptidoglycan/LPS O-acetylase OafA/YrhL